jgi:hypothetical protein
MIQNTIEQLKAERKVLDDLIERAEKLQGDIAGLQFIIRSTMPDPEPMRNAEGGESAAIQGLSTAEAAARLLKGMPATTHGVLCLLARHGHKVGGKKPLVTLYSALKRSKVIRRLPDKKWGSLL